MSASFTKLRSGDWGIRVTGQTVRKGDSVTVAKKDGTTSVEVVKQVVWTGNGITLCAIEAKQRAQASSRSVCAECGKGGSLVSDLEDGLMKHRRCCDIAP